MYRNDSVYSNCEVYQNPETKDYASLFVHNINYVIVTGNITITGNVTDTRKYLVNNGFKPVKPIDYPVYGIIVPIEEVIEENAEIRIGDETWILTEIHKIQVLRTKVAIDGRAYKIKHS